MEFVCRVGTSEGQILEDVFEALDERALRTDLEGRGFHVFRVRHRGLLSRFPIPRLGLRRRKNITGRRLLVFNQQLAALLRSVIAVGSLGISSLQFIERVAYSTDLTDFYVGLSKAPVFALLIAMVGTLRGMQVKSSAEELGLKTTMAVVQSIFLIIVADALFAVLFTRLGI